jgi:hypothetical protein
MPVSRAVATMFILVLFGSASGCNPTWTRDGQPNQSSMPLPPDATPPAKAQPATSPKAAG